MFRQHRLKFLAASIGLFALAMTGTAEAGRRGCPADVAECYEQVPVPVIHKTYHYRLQEERGLYEIARRPSLYGWATQRAWEHRDAVYKTVTVRQKLRSRIAWEKRWVDGRYVMCKVRVPGEIVEREKRVLVSPARMVRTSAYEGRRILLRPYRNVSVYHRARYRHVSERLTIQPEAYTWQRAYLPVFGD